MSYTIRPYDESLSGKWDEFVMQHAMNGTFLHTRRFLSYHPEGRFTDASLMIYNGQELCAVIPAAVQAVDGKRMLRALSGKTHRVLTGMCLKNAATGEEFIRCDGADITFDEMREEEISSYVASGEPMDKAGAYGIQGLGGAYIARISGDYYATVGLSVCGLRKVLKQAAIYK